MTALTGFNAAIVGSKELSVNNADVVVGWVLDVDRVLATVALELLLWIRFFRLTLRQLLFFPQHLMMVFLALSLLTDFLFWILVACNTITSNACSKTKLLKHYLQKVERALTANVRILSKKEHQNCFPIVTNLILITNVIFHRYFNLNLLFVMEIKNILHN